MELVGWFGKPPFNVSCWIEERRIIRADNIKTDKRQQSTGQKKGKSGEWTFFDSRMNESRCNLFDCESFLPPLTMQLSESWPPSSYGPMTDDTCRLSSIMRIFCGGTVLINAIPKVNCIVNQCTHKKRRLNELTSKFRTDNGELDEDVARRRPSEIDSAPVDAFVVIDDVVQ